MINDFLITEVNLEGFQIVHGSMFRKQPVPQLTLWKNALQFNTASYNLLSRCDTVHILINQKTRQILVRPCPSKDTDAVAWIKNPVEPRATRIECTSLMKQIFSGWGFDAAYHYRSSGILVKNEERLMLCYDFRKPEVLDGLKLVKHT